MRGGWEVDRGGEGGRLTAFFSLGEKLIMFIQPTFSLNLLP